MDSEASIHTKFKIMECVRAGCGYRGTAEPKFSQKDRKWTFPCPTCGSLMIDAVSPAAVPHSFEVSIETLANELRVTVEQIKKKCVSERVPQAASFAKDKHVGAGLAQSIREWFSGPQPRGV